MKRVKDLEDLLQNKYYQRYYKQKQKIKDKYDEEIFFIPEGYKGRGHYPQEHRDDYREYLKELSQLIFQPNGWYQKFVWDTMPENEKLLMESRATAKTYGRKNQFNYY